MQLVGRSQIDSVRFSVFSEEQIARRAAVEVTTSNGYTGGVPAVGGLNDTRMGTPEIKNLCGTCRQNKHRDTGHPGAYKLRMVIEHPVATDDIRRWAKIICLQCGHLLINPNAFMAFGPGKRLNMMSAGDTSKIECKNCGTIHPKIVKDPDFSFILKAQRERDEVEIIPHTLAAAFGKISDQTLHIVGRSPDSHPKNYFTKILPISPVTIRPGVKNIGAITGDASNDLTQIYQHIIRLNSSLPEHPPEPFTELSTMTMPLTPEILKSLTSMRLLYHALAKNRVVSTKALKRTLNMGGKPITTIYDRISGKEGRIRKDLVGMRVFEIARSTISGDCDMKIDEVALPLKIARTLQIEETVQEYNKEYLSKFFHNGKSQYPGASRIKKLNSGASYDLSSDRNNIPLEYGDIIYRDMIDGDYIFMNRQPTLSRSSLGVHKVKIIADSNIMAISFNVSACSNYGADFDGDQMNAFHPSTIATIIETGILSHVSNWFISTQKGSPINGEVQDSILGLYMLTRDSVIMSRKIAMKLLRAIGIDTPVFPPEKETYTGKEVISLVLKKHVRQLSITREPNCVSGVFKPYIQYSSDDLTVNIERGELKTGILDKKSVGPGIIGGVFHTICTLYGPMVALDMVYALQQIALCYLDIAGPTIGICDLVVPRHVRDKIDEAIKEVKVEANLISNSLLNGMLIPPIGMTRHEYYEKSQITALKVNDGVVMSHVLGNMNKANGLLNMVASGSKGNTANILNICAVVGQILVNGKRSREIGGQVGRPLPYRPKGDVDPSAYGFVNNSYTGGTTLTEFILGSLAGRADLITKALTTAHTGWMTRKALMTMQTYTVDNLGHCSNAHKIIQYIYGDNGFDTRMLEKVNISFIMKSSKDVIAQISADAPKTPAMDKWVTMLKELVELYQEIGIKVEETAQGNVILESVLLPVNIRNIAKDALTEITYVGTGNAVVADNMSDMVDAVWDFIERLPYRYINRAQERKKAPYPEYLKTAVNIIRMHALYELRPSVLKNLNMIAVKYIIDRVEYKIGAAKIDYGSAVGIASAQAFGEPITQYMLDSHHRSATGGTSKSGIERVVQIFDAKSSNIENAAGMASMLLIPKPEFRDDKDAVQRIANNVKIIRVMDVIQSWDVLIESPKNLVYPTYKGDAEWIASFEKHYHMAKHPADLTNICIRCVLDKTSMLLKSISLDSIVMGIRSYNPNGLYLMHTSISAKQRVIRIYLRGSIFTGKIVNRTQKIHEITEQLRVHPIRGIVDVLDASVIEISRHEKNEEGALESKKYYAVETFGTNVYGALLEPDIIPELISSSSVDDTFNIFGIEAARNKIIKEATKSFGEGALLPIHLGLIADAMTRDGNITALERNGVAVRERHDVLLRMANAAPYQTVVEAALHGAESKVFGVAPSMMVGSVAKVGTLYNSVTVDGEFVRQNTKSSQSVLDEL